MAMAAGAALLRSVATKVARPPPRLPTSSGGLCLPSRFSTSTGASTPSSSANIKGPQNYNKQVPSGNEWDWFLAGVKSAVPMAACGLVLGGFTFVQFFLIPALDRLDARMGALRDQLDAYNEEMKQKRSERSMGSQMEAIDLVGEFF